MFFCVWVCVCARALSAVKCSNRQRASIQACALVQTLGPPPPRVHRLRAATKDGGVLPPEAYGGRWNPVGKRGPPPDGAPARAPPPRRPPPTPVQRASGCAHLLHERAQPVQTPCTPAPRRADKGTTHFCVVDSERNAVSITSTVCECVFVRGGRGGNTA